MKPGLVKQTNKQRGASISPIEISVSKITGAICVPDPMQLQGTFLWDFLGIVSPLSLDHKSNSGDFMC